jgi:nitrite reductase/ring-hydroxylating ferredoxin subunit
MAIKERLVPLDAVPERGSYLFTVHDGADEAEVILVRTGDECDAPVRAYRNFCQHETDQKLDRGFGAAIRPDGGIVCPKHGSMFDTCSGHCDNGKAAGSTLVDVEVVVEDDVVYLADDGVRFAHEGGIEEDDDGPSSTSHLSF